MAKGSKTGGRQAGTPNAVSGTVRAKFLDVFLDLQNIPQYSLREWATSDTKNLTQFYALATKLIPTEISGPGGGPVQTQALPMTDKEIMTRYMEQKK